MIRSSMTKLLNMRTFAAALVATVVVFVSGIRPTAAHREHAHGSVAGAKSFVVAHTEVTPSHAAESRRSDRVEVSAFSSAGDVVADQPLRSDSFDSTRCCCGGMSCHAVILSPHVYMPRMALAGEKFVFLRSSVPDGRLSSGIDRPPKQPGIA
jgi:hypothetical protein